MWSAFFFKSFTMLSHIATLAYGNRFSIFKLFRMITYNKFSAALLLLCVSQWGNALTLGKPDIQSAKDQLLYIEIPYTGASDNQNFDANLANGAELAQMGVSNDFMGHDLNFFVRRTGAEDGVIVITSSRPVNTEEIQLVMRVQDGRTVHVKQVNGTLPQTFTPKTTVNHQSNDMPLIPKQIVSEKEIALTLPQSSTFTSPDVPVQTPVAQEQNRAISYSPEYSQPEQNQVQTPVAIPAPVELPKFNQDLNSKPNTTPTQSVDKKTTKKVSITNDTVRKNTYQVKSQDTLWSIASRISEQSQRPISQVMRELKTLNERAFVHGNINHLRQGAILNTNVAQQKSGKRVAEKPKAISTAPQKTKYRLNQAEMTLVGDKNSGAQPNTSSPTSEIGSHEISNQVLAARERTVNLQNNVTQLDQNLRRKDLKLELLNTRLAQLQQQLKQQNSKKTSP